MIHPSKSKAPINSSRHYVAVNNINGMGMCSKCSKEYKDIRDHVMKAHGIDPVGLRKDTWRKKYPMAFYTVYVLLLAVLSYMSMNTIWSSLIIDIDPSTVFIGEETEIYITGQMDEGSFMCFVPEYLNVPSIKMQRICAIHRFFFCPYSTRIPCPIANPVSKRRVTVQFAEFGDFRVCPMVNHMIDCSDSIKIRVRHSFTS